MIHKQWEPLTTAEAVVEAIKAGRHVEVKCVVSPCWGRTTHVVEDRYVEWNMDQYAAEYRALIAPAQTADRPMNIIEEAKRLLHSEDHRGLHPEIHAFLRAVAGLEPACMVVENYIEGGKCWRIDRGLTAYTNLYILEPTND